MKFIHLSDLHLGKRINEFSMLEDQKYILDQIFSVICQKRADAVLIAGDVYDKPVPSAEAVQLFDDFLTRLADKNICVCVISGNHDSAQRLAFGSQLMQKRGVYMSPVYDGHVQVVSLKDEWGAVNIYLLPFIKPATVRAALAQCRPDAAADPEQAELHIETYTQAVQAAIDQMEIDKGGRNVLMAHQFITGAASCESEEVSVGGLDNVAAAVFDDFDYVALGHIHTPQHMSREVVRYCGTPLKYSFSEAGQGKSVTVVQMKAKGEIVIEAVPLKPLRDMRKIRGTYDEVMSRSFYEGTNTRDYIQMTLTDEADIVDGMMRLRTVYPNLMRLEYDNQRTRQHQALETLTAEAEKAPSELFAEFFRIQNNQEMDEVQAEFMRQLIGQVTEEEA